MRRNRIRFVLVYLAALSGVSYVWGQPRSLTLEDFRPHQGNWRTASEAEQEGKTLRLTPGAGLITNGATGKTTNLLTREEFSDLEVYVEFLVPEGSNSGVYLQGRYEVQIRDSFGKENPGFGDCGGIYQRWEATDDPNGRGWEGYPPRVNASKPAGEWQTLSILFRGPRFDDRGNKVEDALFVQVVLNGVVVQQDIPVSGPTRSSTYQDERPRGPLMLQGDHGPVAYRNVRVRELDLDHTGAAIGRWQPLDLEMDFEILVEDPHANDPSQVMQVENGQILALYDWPDGKSAPHGVLLSKNRYSHFDLEFEMRYGGRRFPPGLDSPGNAGFLYHVQATTPIWPPCLEMQGQETRQGDHFSIRGVNAQQVNSEGNRVLIPNREFAYAGRWSSPDQPEWNTLRIEVRGDRARYLVNGIQVNEIRNATYGGLPCTAGFIGFQAEFAEVIYRNLRIRLWNTY